MDAVGIAVLVAMLVGLLLIPLGLPGLWVMLLALAVPTWRGDLAPGVYLALVVLGGAAEVAEFLVVKRASARWGGSNRVFWGAILGGLAGALVGTPIPVIGSLVGVFAGSFLGALAFAWAETRRLDASVRAGWGAVVGRAAAAGLKVLAGLVVLVTGLLVGGLLG